MLFRQLFDKDSCTYTYLIADMMTGEVILVDPVLEQVERDIQLVRELGLTLKYCIETHIHADHITGSGRLQDWTGSFSIVPKKAQIPCADDYLDDGDILELGKITIAAIATPGHTDSHLSYLINGTHLLTGDALFIRGCGRTDFQNGDAGTLYDSVTQKLFTLSEEILVYPGHDYKGQTVSSIAEEKRWNPRFMEHDRDSFMNFMNNLNLPTPTRMMEAIPANERCGRT
jgi:sulfur dioxygenase